MPSVRSRYTTSAVLVQVIEVPAPVRPDGEDIHVVVADIIDFLAVVLLGYHLIGNARAFTASMRSISDCFTLILPRFLSKSEEVTPTIR